MENQYDKGRKMFLDLSGHEGEKLLEALRNASPDLEKITMEFPFGNIYQREGLNIKQRELITIAALTILGNAAPQLKIHVRMALTAGCTKAEITETILQMAVYGGFPCCLNAMIIAAEVFNQPEQA